MTRYKEHQNMSEALRAFVDKNKLQKGLDKVDVEKTWEQEMGPAIAKYTTGIKFEKETLYVRLSSSVLREELSYGKEKIIRNLNEALGKELIEKIVLQ
ncbi:DUF721 domain-containing protein [Haloflavibacter putidus]|uniref:DUF721 domain-containing protein n=1 Tax=Haloflavibacter putidus TaxID=2576776 RepID=A0A507ZHS6_9FLAO|nr:DUF721 domain-containing protein [Haloflavibacter putidus]TQD35428.1 DUF721 domain-containing protein [Haloflavibacter putidus]